jgi:hypothetical protein
MTLLFAAGRGISTGQVIQQEGVDPVSIKNRNSVRSIRHFHVVRAGDARGNCLATGRRRNNVVPGTYHKGPYTRQFPQSGSEVMIPHSGELFNHHGRLFRDIVPKQLADPVPKADQVSRQRARRGKESQESPAPP